MYFPYQQVNSELRILCPPIDDPGKIVEWRNKRYYLVWHSRYGVFVKRIKGERSYDKAH